jgi:2-polyprenyl-6-methoxyphenol hydroxylase-like FAD-dependent oxidoreductase
VAETCDVAVVGAGPVGLWLALRLSLSGVRVRVFERRAAPSVWSRAIGIHPPALACLARVGVLETLRAEGVPIVEADAYYGSAPLGRASFAGLRTPHPYALSVPQSITERVLEQALAKVAPGALTREQEVSALCERRDHVELVCGGETHKARVVVGADGKYSRVREAIGGAFVGGAYRDGFLMGDFRGSPALGERAFVSVGPLGVVESFPLPQGARRWVARTAGERPVVDAEVLARVVTTRTGQPLHARDALVMSAFVAEHFRATRLCSARMALAGDAAHVLSPLGGQGMNLGLLDAEALGSALLCHFHAGSVLGSELSGYARARRRAARRAERRASLYLAFARPGRALGPVRALAIRALLGPRLHDAAAAAFTMLGESPS